MAIENIRRSYGQGHIDRQSRAYPCFLSKDAIAPVKATIPRDLPGKILVLR